MQEGGASREAFPLVRGGGSEDLILNAYESRCRQVREILKTSELLPNDNKLYLSLESSLLLYFHFRLSGRPATDRHRESRHTLEAGRETGSKAK